MIRLAREAGRVPVLLPVPPIAPTDPEAVAAALEADPDISHVGLVYSETGSGIIHDVRRVGAVVRPAGPADAGRCGVGVRRAAARSAAQPEIDASASPPTSAWRACRAWRSPWRASTACEACAGNAGSWSFDLRSIYAHALRSGWGSFRFTPPAQVLNAFNVALDLFDAEGGQPARLARYTANMRTFYDGVRGLGLTPYLPPTIQGPIIVNVHAPADPALGPAALRRCAEARAAC